MPEASEKFRPATIDDAPVLAELVNYASEGMALYLWEQMAEPGETVWDVGRRRAARDDGSFSYRNADIIEHDGEAAGCLIGYEIADEVEPVPDDTPALFRPLMELENLAPGTWYVNVLAVVPDHRNKGLGEALLARADNIGRDLGKRGMSLIVSDGNPNAQRLYERCGYEVAAQRAMFKDGWENKAENWILMTKKL